MRLGLLYPPLKETSLHMQFHACHWNSVTSQFQRWTGLIRKTSLFLYSIAPFSIMFSLLCCIISKKKTVSFFSHCYFAIDHHF